MTDSDSIGWYDGHVREVAPAIVSFASAITVKHKPSGSSPTTNTGRMASPPES